MGSEMCIRDRRQCAESVILICTFSHSQKYTPTQTAHTSAATDNFTVTATDAEGQTAARAFSISYTFGATGSGGFN